MAVVGDSSLDVYTTWGGPTAIGGQALNVAVGLASHGRLVELHTVVGEDSAGGRALALLRQHGVPTDHVHVEPRRRTASTILSIETGGERQILEEHYGIVQE